MKKVRLGEAKSVSGVEAKNFAKKIKQAISNGAKFCLMGFSDYLESGVNVAAAAITAASAGLEVSMDKSNDNERVM